jgi:hypothetical protein
MMPRSLALVLALATLSVGAHAYATDAAGPGTSSDNVQTQQAAPIVRAYPDQNGAANTNSARTITSSHPIAGVALRVDANTGVETVSADAKGTELRITHGVADVSVHHPENKDARILVDLPGGQTALLKDGLYTFNADTNTVRVLKGEGVAYPGAAVDGIKVKEDHQFVFAAAASKATESSRDELLADYLPSNNRNGDGAGRAGYGAGYGPGYGPYGDGFYGYPYGYPYGYGFGYPYGFGLGFGYFGGFGGFRGGFHGGHFR